MSIRNAMALALTLVLGFAAIWQLQTHIDTQRAAIQEERDDLLVTSPRLLKIASLEYAPLLADIYWTRAVQYYGGKHAANDPNLMLLWPMLDIATTLDPQLLPAYRFGGMFVSDNPPRGAGRPDLAVQLMERGIQANPDYWRFYEDLGFIYYISLKDYAKASEAFLQGSKNPNAALWMKAMAAKIAAEGESLETSAFLWNEIYQTAKDKDTKQGALEHLQLVEVQMDIRRLNQLADEYETRYGKRATRIAQLVQAGLLRGLPGDPRGYPYEFGDDGQARLSERSPLLEKQKQFDSIQSPFK